MNLISVMKLMQSFQWVVFRNNQSSLLVNLLFLKVIPMHIPCKFIAFEGDFYAYISGFVGRDIK